MSTPDKTSPTVTRALDPALYSDASVFERERQTVFHKSWRLVGHENMLDGAGRYLADTIAGVPILVVRTENGDLKGYHNVCLHRAGPLVLDEAGSCGKELTCKYHGWRYTLDGRLKVARDFGAASDFDARDYTLHPVTIDTWRGFIFATLHDQPDPLAEEMAPVAQGWMENHIQPFAFRRSHTIQCNWKTYVENYLEGYHVPDVHPGLDQDVDSARYRVEMIHTTAVHHAPSRKDDGVYSGYWAWVWPWLGVNVYQYGVMMERITPLSVDTTRLDYLYYFDPARHDELQAMIALSDEVTGEDVRICEYVQRNLDAGIYRAGPLSPKHENAVAWFQETLRDVVGYGR